MPYSAIKNEDQASKMAIPPPTRNQLIYWCLAFEARPQSQRFAENSASPPSLVILKKAFTHSHMGM
jgi:hypothetical protein